MIKFNTKGLEKDFEKYKRKLEEGLKEAVRTYVQDFTYHLTVQNIVGDDTSPVGTYWYNWRTAKNPSLYPQAKAGMSKSNWRVVLGNPSGAFQQTYNTNEEIIANEAYNDLKNYTLGQKIFIVNKTPYVEAVSPDVAGVGKLGSTDSNYQITVADAYIKSYGNFTVKLANLGITK